LGVGSWELGVGRLELGGWSWELGVAKKYRNWTTETENRKLKTATKNCD